MVAPGHAAITSKSESRNPKEIRMKAERWKPVGKADGERAGGILICPFPLRASFGFRDSDFGFAVRTIWRRR
jgi:hypothetical protein